VLTGDALQALSFQILSSDPNMTILPGIRSSMIQTLSSSVGSRGMAGGQAIDLDSVGKALSISELEAMHIHKTGALIRASMRMATLNKPSLPESHVMALDHYAKYVGLAFQIRDDILDVEGDTETLGKQSGADIALNKPTFPGIIGMTASKEQAQKLYQQALESIAILGPQANVLRDIADFIVARIH
jgi:farnesyl diphosphate synthase